MKTDEIWYKLRTIKSFEYFCKDWPKPVLKSNEITTSTAKQHEIIAWTSMDFILV